ncbi:MAG: hypothetical protein HY320_14775, partial [Armatimonadetes bacterium]|nr:hypothetical protein [Armatimonadota bacterium]
MKFPRLPLAAPPAGVSLSQPVTPERPAFLPISADEPLDLALCFESGQIFRWQWAANAWHGPFGASALALTRTPDGVKVEVAGPAVPLEAVWRFLGLHLSLPEVYRRIGIDPVMHAAIAALP